jgi:hypothetical protein
MADTNHAHSDIPIEGDGVSYSGIGWFIVVLVVTVVVCEVLVWGLFKVTERYRLDRPEIVRAPMAQPVAVPELKAGRLETGIAGLTAPALLVDEPVNLKAFRDHEQKMLHTYGWANEGTQTVRLTIDRAKELVIERGLEARPAPPAAATSAPPAPTAAPAPAPAAHAPAPAGH